MRAWCSALSVLASSSGVASERAAFMGLVRNEIDRLNAELVNRGSVSMIFQRGNVKARPARFTCGLWLCQVVCQVCGSCGQQVPWCCRSWRVALVGPGCPGLLCVGAVCHVLR